MSDDPVRSKRQAWKLDSIINELKELARDINGGITPTLHDVGMAGDLERMSLEANHIMLTLMRGKK